MTEEKEQNHLPHVTPEVIARLRPETGPGAAQNKLDKTVRTEEEREEEGVVDREEPKLQYELKVGVLRLLGCLPPSAAICLILGYFTGIIKDPYSPLIGKEGETQNFALDYVWMFDSKDPHFNGGEQILNILEASKTAGVDYNDRSTWGFQDIPKVGLVGGNAFGIKAKSLVVWTEDLRSQSGRQELIKAAQKSGQGLEGISKFDKLMNQAEVCKGSLCTWDEVKAILQKDFGFQEKYLKILTTLRSEYSSPTGKGNLQEVINQAKTTSRLEQRVPERVRTAENLLQLSGLNEVVDGETLVAIANSLPSDTNELHASVAVNEIFLNLSHIKPPVGIEGAQFNSALMMAITLGYVSRETPRFFNWAREKLKEVAGKNRKLTPLLPTEKMS